MLKTVMLIGVGVCIAASQAVAETPAGSGGTITVASSSGLHVRIVASQAALAAPNGNVCAGAINTDGVSRATSAIKTGGRVFLVGSGSSHAIVRPSFVAARPPRIDVQPRRQSPQGLGVLIAKLFGVAGTS